MKESPILREATALDSKAIWSLANLVETRRYSLNDASISWENHTEWFQSRLGSSDCRIWLADGGDELAGYVRYETTGGGVAKVSLAVAPKSRGGNLGSFLLTATGESACRELNVEKIEATILKANVASLRTFARAGYREKSSGMVVGKECLNFEWP